MSKRVKEITVCANYIFLLFYLIILLGFLSSSPSNDTHCNDERSVNEDLKQPTENNVFTDDSNKVGSHSKLLSPVSKACSQRRKSFSRSNAICSPHLDQYGSQTSIDVIDYVHNNKKEKITVIVNLLSDEMLLNQRHDKDSYSAAKIDHFNLNLRHNSHQATETSSIDPVNTSDQYESSETEPHSIQQSKSSSLSMKALNGPNIVSISNEPSTKGKISSIQVIIPGNVIRNMPLMNHGFCKDAFVIFINT